MDEVNNIITTKVCIVGAGPSGAATAIFLGKKKINHVIIDAAVFPRDKVCGDGLDLKAIAMLNHIDPKIIENETKPNGKIKACWGFRLISPKGKFTNFVFEPSANFINKPPYGVAKRLLLDDILVKKFDPQYTTFYQNTKATLIERKNDKWHISTKEKTIICDVLIGADGDHSVVLKTVGDRKINRNHYAGGLRQYWQGISDIHEKNLLEIYYPKSIPMSYFWIFPLGNGLANVGFGTLSKVIADKNYNIKELFEGLLKTDQIIAKRFANATALDKINGWGLPMASLRRQCFGNGWLLVGDAASIISPTTGEGIGTGMSSGYIAAQFIEKAINENNFSEDCFKNYDREIYRRIEDDIRLFEISMWFSPKMYGWVMNNIVHLGFFKKLFQKKLSLWIETAYNKTLVVNLD
jgi:menaquinone-9 beta-reductase